MTSAREIVCRYFPSLAAEVREQFITEIEGGWRVNADLLAACEAVVAAFGERHPNEPSVLGQVRAAIAKAKP